MIFMDCQLKTMIMSLKVYKIQFNYPMFGIAPLYQYHTLTNGIAPLENESHSI